MQYNRHSNDREAPVPEGIIVRFEEEEAVPVYYADGRTGKKIYSSIGAISVNPVNIIHGTLVSCGRDNGCCGSNGLDGENRACRCGEIVGTEWSDCYTQAEVRFMPTAVIVEELSAK